MGSKHYAIVLFNYVDNLTSKLISVIVYETVRSAEGVLCWGSVDQFLLFLLYGHSLLLIAPLIPCVLGAPPHGTPLDQ